MVYISTIAVDTGAPDYHSHQCDLIILIPIAPDFPSSWRIITWKWITHQQPREAEVIVMRRLCYLSSENSRLAGTSPGQGGTEARRMEAAVQETLRQMSGSAEDYLERRKCQMCPPMMLSTYSSRQVVNISRGVMGLSGSI